MIVFAHVRTVDWQLLLLLFDSLGWADGFLGGGCCSMANIGCITSSALASIIEYIFIAFSL